MSTTSLHAGSQSVLGLYMHYAWCHNHQEFRWSTTSWIWRPSPCSHPLPRALTLFLLPLSWGCLSTGRRRWSIYVPFRAEHAAVSYTLHRGQLWVSVLTTICYKQKLLWWGLTDALICRNNDKLVGVSY